MRTKCKREMECNSCGSMATVVRGTYPFKESGLENVTLSGIEMIQCSHCGNIDPIIPRMNDLMRVLAIAVIFQRNRLRGDEIRFLRKFVGKNGKEFCEILGIDKSTLSKWENNEDRVGPSNDRLIRAVVIGLGDDELKKQLKATIDMFRKIDEDKTRQNGIDLDAQKMSCQYA